jgi:hypothetical protein
MIRRVRSAELARSDLGAWSAAAPCGENYKEYNVSRILGLVEEATRQVGPRIAGLAA